jgi:hypothetical protein
MTIRRVVPDIASERIDESRDFYVGLLGFTVAMDMGWVVTYRAEATRSSASGGRPSDGPEPREEALHGGRTAISAHPHDAAAAEVVAAAAAGSGPRAARPARTPHSAGGGAPSGRGERPVGRRPRPHGPGPPCGLSIAAPS